MSNINNYTLFFNSKLPYTHATKNGINNYAMLFNDSKMFQYRCTIQGPMAEVSPIVSTHWYSAVQYSDYGNFVEMTITATKMEAKTFKKRMKMEFGEKLVDWKRIGLAN
jgi:hypothetical protein